MYISYIEARVATLQYNQEHGSFFDRGSADSYYSREPIPHRGGVAGFSGPRIESNHPEDVQAYMAGYEFNEIYGDKKDWS